MWVGDMNALERVAIAISGAPFASKASLRKARAALNAMKYEDGTDESALIQASSVVRCDPVAISEAWDAMIDAHLAGV